MSSQELVAIDGKTLRGSFKTTDKSDALHLIHASNYFNE